VLALGSTSSMAAGKKMKLSVGGSMEALVGYAKQSDGFTKDGSSGTTLTSRNTIDQKMDSEVHLNGSTKTDGGLTVKVHVQLEADQATAVGIDASFVTISGGFGELSLGSNVAAAAAMAVQAPNTGAIGATGPDSSAWIATPPGIALAAGGIGVGGGDAAKIRWKSKAFSGFTIGADYTPSNTNGNAMALNGGTLGVESDQVTAAMQYSGKIGKNAVKAGINYWTRDAGVASVDGYMIGVSATMGSITVGAAMDETRSQGNAAGGGSISGTATSLDADGINVGASWAQGGTTLSLNYFNKSMEMSSAVGGEDSVEKWTLGAKYAMGPGVDFVGNIQNVKWDDESAAATLNNQGTIIVGGISVGF
jgi:outer membrane protein OmpU